MIYNKISDLNKHCNIYNIIILQRLKNAGETSFNQMKDVCSFSDGNMANYAKRLATLGFIEVRKNYHKSASATTYTITKKGEDYYNELTYVLQNILNEE